MFQFNSRLHFSMFLESQNKLKNEFTAELNNPAFYYT